MTKNYFDLLNEVNVNGKTEKIYSSWSAAKSATSKK